MALLYPSWEIINNLKVSPEVGERHLLDFLCQELDDTYEIYFQPFLHGDRPDIIILRENFGISIIEVKDWNLEYFYLDSRRQWRLKKNDTKIKSPLDQARAYKESIYNLHLSDFLKRKIGDPRKWTIISLAVYFHNSNKQQVWDFLTRDFTQESNYEDYVRYLNYHTLWGRDSLSKESLQKFLYRSYLSRKSYHFADDVKYIYDDLRKVLHPPIHVIEEGIPITYTKEQEKLIVSKKGEYKVKGVAGSGKTLVLAKRAVNSFVRHRRRVLILTFNITLRNYIHDKISDVREEFSWDNFFIINYHEFINTQMRNHGIEVEDIPEGQLEDKDEVERFYEEKIYSNLELFSHTEKPMERYETILIDEVQDFKENWIRMIRKYFLDTNGEFVLFGDEKQNIYNREMGADRKPNTTIPGRWRELKKSYRLSETLTEIANSFQELFFGSKYELDNIESAEQLSLGLMGSSALFGYRFWGDKAKDIEIYQSIYETIKKVPSHNNDIVLLSDNISFLRNLEFFLREDKNIATEIMFERKEEYDSLKQQFEEKPKGLLRRELENIRRNRKIHFWMCGGNLKLSTTHSFKGWEIPTLILVIDSRDEWCGENDESLDELIYTSLTRCRQNLFVININNRRYDEFFKEQLSTKG